MYKTQEFIDENTADRRITTFFASSSFANEKLNVVIMMVDKLGYGDLGAYGGGEVRGMPTPRIDKLANEGLRFTQFLVEPGCTPSRVAANYIQ